jgi:hypothetical protein
MGFWRNSVDPKWDFMYLIEVMDNCGNGKIYPDFSVEKPYIVVRLKRDEEREKRRTND